MATEKTFRVSSVEYDKPTKSNNIDWANCILCQEIIDEKLICPFDSKRLNVGAGYQSLADNIKKFHELRLMPEGINVCIENLDEGSGIAQSFIDQKACWHKSCNLKLNRTKLNRAEKRTSHERIDDKATTSKRKLDIAFPFSPPVTRLCAFSVMKMAKKPFMSPQRLDKIHVVNSSRLKHRIVSNFPNLDAYKQGLENILAFKDDIGPALKRVCLEDFDNEFVNISKAATFVRKDIFASNSEFKGTFPKGCQEASVPQSLLSLVKDVQGVVQTFDQSEPMLKCQSKRVSLLPESYSNLPPAVLRFSEPDIPLVEGELSIDMSSFPAALKGEFKWLNSCG
ncbi:unnamed protein product [Mytilus edulis]|uniref:Uncharacterized protein n=1 Tax=Mytilus edulis TaxID=6550 RepID=A0A8S3RGJ8_MYTED|nr:unnamed protein product [Mytilus edulis]